MINKHKGVGLEEFNNSKGFFEYSNDMDDIYGNIEEDNPNKERKVLIVFHDMIADMLSNKNLNPTLIESFIRNRKLNSFLVFITKSYFGAPKNIRLISTHYFIMKFQISLISIIAHQILTVKTSWIFIKYTIQDIFPSDQSRMEKQAKFTYSPLRKALEKQTKTIEYQGR